MSVYLGLMSGTSMDGIDVALMDFQNNQLIAGRTYRYSEETQARLFAILQEKTASLASISQLNVLIGRDFAHAALALIEEANQPHHTIRAIGSHGQTIAHDAQALIPYTWQLGCAHTIAAMTGIDVVADFRTRDLANGGRGAPFAPLYHQALFQRQSNQSLVLVNIGGIANVSFFHGKQVLGYDTGPGNCLMDAWIQRHQDQPYDKQGAWAQEGKVQAELLAALCADPYFNLPYPKSIGKEYFSLDWLQQCAEGHESPEDIQATLLQLTAWSIAAAIRGQDDKIDVLAVCGGGAHNQALLHALQEELPTTEVMSTEMLGVSPDFIEAMMFAWFAEKAIQKIPLDMHAITGAKKPAILGVIYPA